MAIVDPPGDAFMERANEVAGAGSLGVDSLDLTNLRPGDHPSRNIVGAITAASCTRTVEGASTLVLTIEDKDLAFLRAPIVDRDSDGQLDSLVVTLDLLRWRLVKLEVDYSATTSETRLTFEEEAVTLLRQHNAPLALSRANTTRAQFAHRLVREVKAYPLGFYSPEESFQQATAKTPRSQTSRDAQRKPGFADGVTLKIKGVAADAAQLREIETVLTVCDEENATGRARLGIVVAGIGESQFRKSATQPNTKAHGVFQLLPATERSTGLDAEDTQGTARHWLLHGYYKYGGGIQIAHDHPDWSAGTIATAVEGSYDPPSKGAAYYDQFHDEARAIVDAWNGDAGGGSSNQRTVIKQYTFRRGLPGKRETSWDCLQRLAGEVGWRCFCVANIVYFISEEQLFMSRARAEIGLDTPGVNSLRADVDQGKNAEQVTLNVDAGMWSFPPGSIIALRDLGPLTGRWLIETIDRPDLFDPATEITLSKPIARKREPAADTIQVPRDAAAATSTDPGSEQNGETGNGPAVDARGVKASTTASARLRKWTNPNGSIVWVCRWMFPQLEYAKKHGWSGVITEGWRSHATEEIYWDRYNHDPGLAARPGTSNHGWTIYPRGAIDTADPSGLQTALRGWTGTPAAMKGNGVALPRDIVHFSHDGQ